jgi:hypothetical protein
MLEQHSILFGVDMEAAISRILFAMKKTIHSLNVITSGGSTWHL